MARYDKYDGVTGGFRAEAAAAADEADYDTVLGASLDADGHVVTGAAGNSGHVGVTIVDRTKRRAGNVLDIMTDGEIVDVDGLTAGTVYYLDAAGALTDVAGQYRVGHTVEDWRLVVRFQDLGGVVAP